VDVAVEVAVGGGLVDEVEVAVVVVVGVGDGEGLLVLHAVVSVALAATVSAAIAATPQKMRWLLLIMMGPRLLRLTSTTRRPLAARIGCTRDAT
jgi:hypothetical protein